MEHETAVVINISMVTLSNEVKHTSLVCEPVNNNSKVMFV